MLLILTVGIGFVTSLSAILVQAQPELTLEPLEPGRVKISWSNGAVPLVLEATDSLSDLALFRPVPVKLIEDRGRTLALLSAKSGTRFFRLRASEFSLTLSEGVTVRAGGAMTLKSENLSAREPGKAPGEIVYTLSGDGYSALLTGFVAFTNAPDQKVTRFTQADIDAGRVIYRDGIEGKILPEIRADAFSFSVSIGTNSESGLRTFLMLRDLPGAPSDDGVTKWNAGDGDAFFDGGPGEDAFVLRGSDDNEDVEVRPSTDGQQIVVRVNGRETVTLDGFEDLYFAMGNGNNSVVVAGDFSRTDLSPSTIFYLGDSSGDSFTCELSGSDYVVNLGDGVNVVQGMARGTFVIGGNDADTVLIKGQEGFQQQVFARAGINALKNGPRASMHLYESEGTSYTEGSSSSGSSIYLVDFDLISQAYRNMEPFGIQPSRPFAPSGTVFLQFGPQGTPFSFLGVQDDEACCEGFQDYQIGFLVHEPAPGSTDQERAEVLDSLEQFLANPQAPSFPQSAHRIQSGTEYLMVDPGGPNAVIGFDLLANVVETLRGSDFDDLIFAGDDLVISDAELAHLPLESDSLFGNRGNDRMIGDRLNNLFDGGPGNDKMDGKRGDDRFFWSSGNDVIDGGDGFDRAIYATDPFSTDDPSARSTSISLSSHATGRYIVTFSRVQGNAQTGPFTQNLVNIEEVLGSPRDDLFSGSPMSDRFLGGAGKDFLHGHGGADYLDGGPDDDYLTGGTADDTLIGGPGKDTIDGGQGVDTIRSDEEDTMVSGGEGDDQMIGGGIVFGGPGNDTITGSIVADTIDGGPGQDQIDASNGEDVGIFRHGEVGSAPDNYMGGPGMDTLRIVIPDPLSVTPSQIAELQNLPAQITSAATFAALGLEISGWERLEIVNGLGAPINPAELRQQPPTSITLSNRSVEEERRGAFIGELTVADPNNPLGDTHTFDLSDPRFEVRNGNRLHLAGGASLDFERATTISLTIGATDRGGNRLEQLFSIQVIDLPDTPMAPKDIRLSNTSFAEDRAGRAVGFVQVDDPNPNESFRFTINDARFEVVNDVLKLRETNSINFETQASVTISITVEDKDQLMLTKSFTLSVIDVEENAPAPVLPRNFLEVLRNRSGFRFHHAFVRTGDLAGVTISGAGDMTGDGFEDMILTSVVFNSASSFASFAFLLPGAGTPFPTEVFRTDLPSRGGTTFTLAITEDRTNAASAAGIGDFNGDGLNDLVFGSGKAESSIGGFEAGQAMVVLGRPGGLPADINLRDANTFNGATAFRIDGAETHEGLGTSVSGAGDIDGDGFDDVLIGLSSPGSFGDGGALILYGRGAPFPPNQVSSNITGLRFTMIESGISVSIGDVNADGYSDLFVTLAGGDGAVILGRSTGLTNRIDPVLTHDVIIAGGRNRVINSVPGLAGPAGDFNSDGFEDFYILTQSGTAPVTLKNDLVVVYGGSTFPERIDLGDNDGTGPNGASPIAYLQDGTRGVQIISGGDFGRLDPADTSFIKGITGAGDVNGDGSDDLLLRVSNATTTQLEHVIVFGGPLPPGMLVVTPGLSGRQGQSFSFPVTPGYALDQGLGGMIDLNGDGFDEIIFADPRADLGFNNFASLAYVLFGGDLSAIISQIGTADNDFLLGGQGADDILIGGLANDSLAGRGGRDVYYGGAGDDLIVVEGAGIPEYARIDGGGGTDTVRLAGNNLVWDLGKTGNSTTNPGGNHLVESIEIFDLGRSGSLDSHHLVLAVDDLLDLPDRRSLMILGDTSDLVTFRGALTRVRSETRTVPGLGSVLFEVYLVQPSEVEFLIAVGVPLRNL